MTFQEWWNSPDRMTSANLSANPMDWFEECWNEGFRQGTKTPNSDYRKGYYEGMTRAVNDIENKIHSYSQKLYDNQLEDMP